MRTTRRSTLHRLIAAAGAVGILVAGCATQQAGQGTTTAAGPGSTAVGITDGATITDGVTVTDSVVVTTTEVPQTGAPWTVPTDPPPTDGPGADATPMFWLTSGPGYYCDTRGTLVPRLVVYSDFSALRVEEGIGAYCENLPIITTGWVDPAEAIRLMEKFQSDDLAGIDLMLDGVYDAGTAHISLAATGGVEVASAYALGYDTDVPEDQVAPRDSMTNIRKGLSAAFQTTGTWTPDRLVALSGSDGSGFGSGGSEDDDGPIPTWPTEAPRTSCGPVADDDVEAVLKAHGYRLASALWKIDGRFESIAIGVVLPGFEPCGSVVNPQS